MRRRQMIAGLILALAAGVPGEAAPLDDIAASLRADGYEVREVSRTWLGRIRIEAVSDRYQREIVFDRVTGEILRDYLTKRRPDRPAERRGEQHPQHDLLSPRPRAGAQTAARLASDDDQTSGDDHGGDDHGGDDEAAGAEAAAHGGNDERRRQRPGWRRRRGRQRQRRQQRRQNSGSGEQQQRQRRRRRWRR